MKLILLLLLSLVSQLFFAQNYSIAGKILSDNSEAIENAQLYFQEKEVSSRINKNGSFRLDSLANGSYKLTLYSFGYQLINKRILVKDNDVILELQLVPLFEDISEITIVEEKENDFGIGRLKPVEGTAIYAGKKSDVIKVDDIAANLATNNARQVYSKVAGLNIWESDGAGIQLGIGGRGLSPNRVSNFNTRQNGYDISADALGYPESYYSPPTEAIEQIELVRGAASLQYGTQFGGFLNFKLKNGPEKKTIELVSRQTLGSFGLFNSFNSVGGNWKKLKYYSYYQYKTGNGWRPNSEFDVHNAHANVSYQINTKLKVGIEYTFMHYLAHQAGGLTDAMYRIDPQQSIRERNWFEVNWNLFATYLDYQFNDRTDFNFRAFGLIAERNAVGVLDQITRADNLNSVRDLLSDQYKNVGLENRLLHRYNFLNNTSIFLIGMRYYHGNTERNQGNGSRAANANFNFSNANLPEDSKYTFPSQNLAFFSENVFYINSKFTVTPGIRYEYISTNADGYYFDRFIANNGDTLKNEQIFEERNNNRSFLLGGIGISYKASEQLEAYSNFSQNYRSINFNDMRIDNPNYQVDPDLKDERGFSFDIGIRGNKSNYFNYDISFFLLSYDDRIGNTLIADRTLFKTIRYRTNISDSRSIGLESFIELNLLALFGKENKKSALNVFSNFSLMEAKYINSKESAFNNKEVELVPEIIFKGGLSYKRERFQISYQYSYTAEQFSDATNAEFASNAVYGLVPAYAIMDLSAKYIYKKITLESGINNLLNEVYFTRRASGYPGPGIIPSDPRNFYLSVGLKL